MQMCVQLSRPAVGFEVREEYVCVELSIPVVRFKAHQAGGTAQEGVVFRGEEMASDVGFGRVAAVHRVADDCAVGSSWRLPLDQHTGGTVWLQFGRGNTRGC